MSKNLFISLILLFIISFFFSCGNDSETGRLEIHDDFKVELSILGRISNVSMSHNFRASGPNISGSNDAEEFTKIIKNKLNNLAAGIYDVENPVEEALITEIRHEIIISHQLRYLTVVIETSTIMTSGEENKQIMATGFRTINGRYLQFNNAFSRNAIPSIITELNNNLPENSEGLIIDDKLFNEVIKDNSWYFTEEDLVVVFNSLANQPLILSVPISFLRTNRLIRH